MLIIMLPNFLYRREVFTPLFLASTSTMYGCISPYLYRYYRETSYHHYRKGQILNRQKSIKTQIIQNFDMIFIIYDIKLDYPQNLRFFNFTEGCQMNV